MDKKLEARTAKRKKLKLHASDKRDVRIWVNTAKIALDKARPLAGQLADMLNEAGYVDDAKYYADCVNTIDEVVANIESLQADLM